MIKAKSLIVQEMDDVAAAVKEAKDALAGFELLENSVGIIQCHSEMAQNGVVKAVCESLGFPVVGITTVAQCVRQGVGDWCLTLLVLTADDVYFHEAMTEGLNDDIFGSIERAREKCGYTNDRELKMILAFPPIIEKYQGGSYIDALTRGDKDIPVFGSLFVNETVVDYSDCATICNNVTRNDEMAFLMVSGNINPRFEVVNLSEKRLLHIYGTVTKSEGDLIMEIDERTAVTFFEKHGLVAPDISPSSLIYMPLVFKAELEDGGLGRPFARVHLGFTPEGYLVSRGSVKPGTKITLGSLHGADVLESTKEYIDLLNKMEGVTAAIMFSCISRRFVCGNRPFDEAELIRSWLREDLTFMLGCSGGEICPVLNSDGTRENKYHSYSLVICLI